MTDAPDIFTQLAAPFPPDRVSWRVGSTNRKAWETDKSKKRRGKPLCYIDARDVMDRFDQVMGPHWQTDPLPLTNGVVCCKIGLLIEGDWLWRGDGAGATDVEGPKGAFSDALKRAAVLWGVGRYLYGIDSPWIDLDEWWQIPKDAYPHLNALLARNGAPPKSARQAHKDGDYTRVEKALRACTTLDGLAKVWKAEQKVIEQWPDGWRGAVVEEKDACKANLEAKANGQVPLQEGAAQ